MCIQLRDARNLSQIKFHLTGQFVVTSNPLLEETVLKAMQKVSHLSI